MRQEKGYPSESEIIFFIFIKAFGFSLKNGTCQVLFLLYFY